MLQFYYFPGNIRELENVIEHAFIKCQDSVISLSHLPKEIISRKKVKGNNTFKITTSGNISQLQNRHIQDVLVTTGGNKTEAAKVLGIHRITLLRKLKKIEFDEKK